MHYHIRSWLVGGNPFKDRKALLKRDRNGMEWYRYYKQWAETYASVAEAMSQCALAAWATSEINFRPVECDGADCHGKESLRSVISGALAQCPFRLRRPDSGDEIQPDQDRRLQAS